MPIIDKIQLSGTVYTIGSDVTVDQSLDSGSTNPVENRVIYNKIDEVEQVTAAGLNALNESKQDTLVSGTNIKTINNESILGSGNIDIQGGGKAIEAGRGISITTGETADTVSFNLPISAGTGNYSIIEGRDTTASGQFSHAEGSNTKANGDSSHAEGRYTTASGNYGSHAEGYYTTASGNCSHAEGSNTKANGDSSHAEGYCTTASGQSSHAEGSNTKAIGYSSHAEGGGTTANSYFSHAEGYYTVANNQSEHASGQYNNSVSASTTFGNSGNTLFSVGNGTADNARHNAFEIRQNGDIYLTKDGQNVKLQDQLGGSSITVDTALDSGSTNPVENRVIYNKIDEVEQVTAAGLNAVNDKFDGLKLMKISQTDYENLQVKDQNTLYIVI